MQIRQVSHNDTWQRILRSGLELQRAGQLEQAESWFERAYRAAPERAEVCYALGCARLRRGDITEAEALLSAAWRTDRDLISAAGALARCLGIHAGRVGEGLAVVAEAEARHGPLPVLEVVRSELYLAGGRITEAEAAAEAALMASDNDSECIAAKAALARVCSCEGERAAAQGQFDQAIFFFRRAAHLDPEWSSAHTNQGVVLARMGLYRRALQAYDEALARDPDCALARENRGLVLRDMGDPEQAREELHIALELDPRAVTAAQALADICRTLGDAQEAIDVLVASLEHLPENAVLWYELGVLLLSERGARADAETCWRRALDLDPQHAGTCARLADLMVREGRLHEARVLAERAAKAMTSSAPEP